MNSEQIKVQGAIFALVLAASLFFIIPIKTTVAQVEAPKFIPYDNSFYLFQVHYPNNLKPLEGPNSVTFFSPEEQVDILFSQLSPLVKSLDQYTKIILDPIRNNDNIHDFKIKTLETNATLGGNPANKVISTYTLGNDTITDVKLVTIKNGVGYAISYLDPPGRFSKNYSDILKMINSFKFTNSTGLSDLDNNQKPTIPRTNSPLTNSSPIVNDSIKAGNAKGVCRNSVCNLTLKNH